MSRVEVIVEPGSCADGSLDRMLALCDLAAEAGATAFKPQFYSDPDRLADRRHMAADNPYRAIYRRYQMPFDWLPVIAERCQARGLEMFCTVYLHNDVRTVAPFVSAFKVSSFESGEHESLLLDACDLHKHRVIVSHGMSEDCGYQADSNLHCVSAYPAPLDSLNLSVVGVADNCGNRFFDGYSDHSADVRVGAWAVAAGARILEVHARLDDTDPANPDYATALSPAQLREYIANVRDCEKAMGDGVKRVQDAERPMLEYRV